MIPSLTPDQIVLARAVLFLVWGFAGFIAFNDVSRQHGWGVGFLMLGAYLALGWLALRP
jgi:hypothetical protein